MKGKKTYIIAVAIALLAFAHAVGWLDEVAYQTLLGLLGAGGLAALRAGVNKESK